MIIKERDNHWQQLEKTQNVYRYKISFTLDIDINKCWYVVPDSHYHRRLFKAQVLYALKRFDAGHPLHLLEG